MSISIPPGLRSEKDEEDSCALTFYTRQLREPIRTAGLRFRVDALRQIHMPDASRPPPRISRVSFIEAIPSRQELTEKIQCMKPLITGLVGGGAALDLSAALLLEKTALAVGKFLLHHSLFTRVAIAASTCLTAASVARDIRLNLHAAWGEGAETVIYVLPRNDGTILPHVKPIITSIIQIAEGKKLVFARISSAAELAHLIQDNKNISHLWITAHGDSSSMQFGPDTHVAADMALQWPLENFSSDAKIILDSCSAFPSLAVGIYNNLQQKLTIIAANDGIRRSVVKPNGTISFKGILADHTVVLAKE